MRIISGKHKGKKLLPPKKLPVRPTTDKAKEALFNILNHRVYWEELKVMDLFAGTGNVSFEFASRGACTIVAIDRFAGCTRYISKIAQELELPITAVTADVFRYLPGIREKYDIIFADPPYDFTSDRFSKIVELVFKQQLLEGEGLLIVEHSPHTDLSGCPQYTGQRKYGRNVFSFFEGSPRGRCY